MHYYLKMDREDTGGLPGFELPTASVTCYIRGIAITLQKQGKCSASKAVVILSCFPYWSWCSRIANYKSYIVTNLFY